MTVRRIARLASVAALLALGTSPISSAAVRATVASRGGCSEQSVSWKHGFAVVKARGMPCARAKHVVRYALNHGLLAPSGNPGPFFALRHRHVLGFTFAADPLYHFEFHARKGAARITFNVCWLNVDC